MRKGFSLVELSIVLAILGLMVGGILMGRSMVRRAEVNTVLTDYRKYSTAAGDFITKYSTAPGDFSNAAAYWSGTTNGNGDGVINTPSGAGAAGEMYQFWLHLKSAGIMQGNFSGLAGGGSAFDSVVGSNVPGSRFKSVGWTVWNAKDSPGDAAAYAVNYANYFVVGGQTAGNATLGAFLTPDEAMMLDTKMDDGKPGFGKVIARYWNNACATGGASQGDLSNSKYNVANSTVQCSLYFTDQF